MDIARFRQNFPDGARVNLPRQASAKSRWWLWIVVLGLIAVGVWYYHELCSGGAKEGSWLLWEGRSRGLWHVRAEFLPRCLHGAKGDLPVYVGLGSVTAFNTVTGTQSRRWPNQGQFHGGQFVHEGDALIEIDPSSLPNDEVKERAEDQLTKNPARNSTTCKLIWSVTTLWQESVVLAAGGCFAQVGTYQGAIKASQATIDNAKLQLVCFTIKPIGGRA